VRGIPLQAESNDLHNLIQHVRDTIADQAKTRSNKLVVPKIIPSLQSELGAPLPLHISLSRTLQIRTENRDDFLETLKSCLRGAAVPAFPFRFHSLKWVPNFERNRWFLVLGIEKPAQNELNRLLNACNQATRRHGQSGLYVGGHGDGPMEYNAVDGGPKASKERHAAEETVDRSDFFHVSIAWNLEEPDPECISDVRSIDVGKFVKPPQATLSVVKARIGNAVHSIDLKRDGKSVTRSKSNNMRLV
jgi:2'-5' RNA ligase